MAGDDKEVAKELRNQNRREQRDEETGQMTIIDFRSDTIDGLADKSRQIGQLNQDTPEEVEKTRAAYAQLTSGEVWWRLENLADIQVAQFFIPKIEENEPLCITHREYKDYLAGRKPLLGRAVGKAMAVSVEKRFFHWFLEFPEILSEVGLTVFWGIRRT